MIYNLGSINADHFYSVPRLPGPGETLAAVDVSTGLGGKGANMSVAAARAGSRVVHIGAVGADGHWAIERMARYGVDTQHIATIDAPTAHAVINVDPAGENAIVIFAGANVEQSQSSIETALLDAVSDDTLVLQNETNLQAVCADMGRKKGMRVVYAAAPYDTSSVTDMLPFTDLLVLNEVEMAQLTAATGNTPKSLGVGTVIVTQGAKGCTVFDAASGWEARKFVAPKVAAVDTTGAGDTFTGYLAAGLDQGNDLETAIARGMAAAALKVTRKGTADAIPSLDQVLDFLD